MNTSPMMHTILIFYPYRKRLIEQEETIYSSISIVIFPAFFVRFSAEINSIWHIAITIPENITPLQKVDALSGSIFTNERVTDDVQMNRTPRKQLILIPETWLIFFWMTIAQAHKILVKIVKIDNKTFNLTSLIK